MTDDKKVWHTTAELKPTWLGALQWRLIDGEWFVEYAGLKKVAGKLSDKLVCNYGDSKATCPCANCGVARVLRGADE